MANEIPVETLSPKIWFKTRVSACGHLIEIHSVVRGDVVEIVNCSQFLCPRYLEEKLVFIWFLIIPKRLTVL